MLPGNERVDEIRDALRNNSTESLARRRKMGLLSAIGLIDFAVISLYQMGVIRHLPDFPAKVFDSDSVNASRKAYAMGLPDGTTGAIMYSVNLALLSAGGTRETGRPKWLSYIIGGSVIAGAVGALDYLYDMTFKQKKICPYCVTGALVNLSLVPLAIKEIMQDFANKSNREVQA